MLSTGMAICARSTFGWVSPSGLSTVVFNKRLRIVDPFDEISFVDLECECFAAAWIGRYLRCKVARGLGERIAQELYLFYRCHRAALRARLAIAHLLERSPRAPEKWPKLAGTYLRLARSDAVHLN